MSTDLFTGEIIINDPNLKFGSIPNQKLYVEPSEWIIFCGIEDKWFLKISTKTKQIIFNIEEYPELTSDEFAKKFIECVHKEFKL